MWVSRFGEAGQPPTPEELARLTRRFSPPDNEIPAGVGLSILLGQSDNVAVGITQMEAFSTGFRFTVAVRVREPRMDRLPLFHLVGAHPAGIRSESEDRLLLGIEYADGRRASTISNVQIPGGMAPDDEQLTITSHNGAGGERAVDQTYWVAPLPPDGPVTVVMAWPGFGIPESRAVLDGVEIRAAAGRSRVLWPPQPPFESPPSPPPPPPPSGWFSYPGA